MNEEVLRKQMDELNPAILREIKTAFEDWRETEITPSLAAQLAARIVLLWRYGPDAGQIKPSDFRPQQRTGAQSKVDALGVNEEVILVGRAAHVAVHRARKKHPGRSFYCLRIWSHPYDRTQDRFRVIRGVDGGAEGGPRRER